MQNPFRVLFLPTYYPNAKKPFDGNFIQNHAKAIAKFVNINVLYCTSYKERKKESRTYNSLTETWSYFLFHPYFIVRLYKKLKAYYNTLDNMSQYKIIHTHVFSTITLFAVLIAIIFRKKIVMTEHNSYFHQFNFIKRIIFKLIHWRINHFAPVSIDMKNTLLRYGVPTDKITVIPNCIDTRHFTILPSGQKNDTVKFLHISNYKDPRKNLKGILKAIEKLSKSYSNFVFEIGGDGDYIWLQNTVNQYNIPAQNIILSKKHSYDTLPKKYNEATAFVLFSHFENFGVVLAESIACGTPVIATSVGGVNDFVNEKNGFLILPNDTNALYLAMEKFILNTTHFNPISVRDSIEKYVSEEAVGAEYFKIYNSLLAK